MATIHHHHTSPYTSTRRPRRHSHDSSLPSSTSSSFTKLLKRPTSHVTSLSHSTTTTTTAAAVSTAATTTVAGGATTADTAYSVELLERHLAGGDFRQADDETRRLLIVLAGEAAVKRGYVFFSEVQFIPKDELKTIDELWKKYSNNRFGYSVQKKIWLKVDKDFTKFFIKVGWMKKLDTEIEQFNYRAFPNEFIWELNDNNNGNDNDNNNNKSVPPEGHLPLTNALRGTQLLSCILSHPAFYDDDDQGDGGDKAEDEDDQGVDDSKTIKKKSRFASFRDRLFKPNYSF